MYFFPINEINECISIFFMVLELIWSLTSGVDFQLPYYLHPSDNPGQIFVYDLLSDNNYGEWVNDMSDALYANNRFDKPVTLDKIWCNGEGMVEKLYQQRGTN